MEERCCKVLYHCYHPMDREVVWKNIPTPSTTQCVMEVDHERKAILVGYRGTLPTLPLVLCSGNMVLVPFVGFHGTSFSARVHQGWYETYIKDRLEVLSMLQIQCVTYPNYDLYFTGHSSGGAIATMLALDVAKSKAIDPEQRIPYCFTFGSPRFGDHAFSSLCFTLLGSRLKRYIHNGDMVPDIPPRSWNYQHAGVLFIDGENPHELTEYQEQNEKDTERWWEMFQTIDTIKAQHCLFYGFELCPEGI